MNYLLPVCADLHTVQLLVTAVFDLCKIL